MTPARRWIRRPGGAPTVGAGSAGAGRSAIVTIAMTMTMAAVLMAAVLTGWSAPPAAADSLPMTPVPTTGASGPLSLRTSVWPLVIPSLAPGESFSWQLGAALTGVDRGELSLGVVSGGSRATDPDGYLIAVQACPQPWGSADGMGTTPTCPDGGTPVLARQPLAQLPADLASPIGTMSPEQPWYLSVTLALANSSRQDPRTGSLVIGLQVMAMGDDGTPLGGSGIGTGSDPGAGAAGVLGWTGLDVWSMVGWGVGAVVVGLLLATAGRARQRARR